MDLLNSLDQYAGDAAKKTRLGQMLNGILSPGQPGVGMQAPSAAPSTPTVMAGGMGRPGAPSGGGALNSAAAGAAKTGITGLLSSL